MCEKLKTKSVKRKSPRMSQESNIEVASSCLHPAEVSRFSSFLRVEVLVAVCSSTALMQFFNSATTSLRLIFRSVSRMAHKVQVPEPSLSGEWIWPPSPTTWSNPSWCSNHPPHYGRGSSIPNSSMNVSRSSLDNRNKALSSL